MRTEDLFRVNNKLLLKFKTKISHGLKPKTRKQKMAYRQTNTKLKTYFKTDSNNKNIFRNSHLTLSWKALHAAIKDNQNNLDMYFVKY